MRDLRPLDPEIRYNLGLVYSQLRRPEDAVVQFDAALALNPAHASALYGKGRALLALEREDEALVALQRSQELAGGQLTTMAGQQYGEQGDLSLAVEDMPVNPEAGDAGASRFTDVTAAAGVPAA